MKTILINLVCRFGIHKWGEWRSYRGTYVEGGDYVRQHRKCLLCGKLKDESVA